MTRIAHYAKTHTAMAGAAAVLALTLGGAGLYYADQAFASTDAPSAAAQLPPQVDVVTLHARNIREWNEFSGRLHAVDFVEIRPQVGGIITQVLFEEGATVKKGAPLYVIDPRPFEADVANAEAELASARSQEALAKMQLGRARKLLRDGHVSKEIFDERTSGYKVAQAAISSAEAKVKRTKLDLEYAHIKAPVAGRVSRAEITEGNVVESGPNAPVLTTIVSNDRIYAEFDVDEQTYVSTVRRSNGERMPVELLLPGDDMVMYKGAIHSFDNRLNTTSGTIRARAEFENTDGALVPGMFVTVRLGSASKNASLLVPERAIGTNQDKKFVYTVDGEGKVDYREVQLGATVEGSRIVLSGLKDGDQVLVNSLQRVRPGMQVTPVEAANKGSDGDQSAANQAE